MPRFAFARNGHEPGRPCSVRPGPAAGPRIRLRPRRVRRAGELHARRGDSGPGRTRRRRARASPSWTCAAELPGPDGSSRESSVAPIWAWTRAPAPSRSRVRGQATFPAASRSREFLRFLPARSTWCSCSRPCSPFPTRRRCSRRYPARSGPAGGSPSRWRKASRSRRQSESACLTPTPSGSLRCRRCSRTWSASDCVSAGSRTTAGRTVPWRTR